MATPPRIPQNRVVVLPGDPAVKMRRMTLDDLDQVLHNERGAYSHPWTEGIFRNCLSGTYENWVLDHNGRLLGHAVLSITLDEAHLLNICVGQAYQGAGWGRRLLEFIIDRARHKGAQGIFLEVRVSNLAAIHLYESVGFCEVGRRRGYYPARRGREDALVMWLALGEELDLV